MVSKEKRGEKEIEPVYTHIHTVRAREGGRGRETDKMSVIK